MPVAGLVNPVTGAPTVGPMAMLIDHIGGLVNHHRRGAREWTVSSELALEVSPDALQTLAAHPDALLVGRSQPLGDKSATGLGTCELTVAGTVVGTGTVRSFFIDAPDDIAPFPTDDGDAVDVHGLAAMLNVGAPAIDGDSVVLPQHGDPVLNNLIGIVHGGVAATGLEVVASAAVNAGRDAQLATASLRVNFLRPFLAGGESRYVGTPLHSGRRSAVADAQAIGADGRVAIEARLTAYRC
jgi:uncharacterized protein (TIGR00369 family)